MIFPFLWVNSILSRENNFSCFDKGSTTIVQKFGEHDSTYACQRINSLQGTYPRSNNYKRRRILSLGCQNTTWSFLGSKSYILQTRSSNSRLLLKYASCTDQLNFWVLMFLDDIVYNTGLNKIQNDFVRPIGEENYRSFPSNATMLSSRKFFRTSVACAWIFNWGPFNPTDNLTVIAKWEHFVRHRRQNGSGIWEIPPAHTQKKKIKVILPCHSELVDKMCRIELEYLLFVLEAELSFWQPKRVLKKEELEELRN